MDGQTVFPFRTDRRTDHRTLSGAFNLYVLYIHIMNNLKTRVLTNGKSTWRLTRFSDDLFIGKNSYGRSHTFRSVHEVNYFEDFLVSKGYTLIEQGRSLQTLVRK